LKAIVCAVPFLRARELKLNHTGESYTEKDQNLIQSMVNHYAQLVSSAKKIQDAFDEKVPLIGTGHLFTAGGKISDSERDLYIGQSKHMPVNQLPCEFDYIALGHLHKYQCPRPTPPVYYSGSPVPLSFNEARHEQSVLVVEWDQNNEISVEKLTVPRFRSLVKIKGILDEIQNSLTDFTVQTPYGFSPWVEIDIQDNHPSPDRIDKITDDCRYRDFELLKVTCKPSPLKSVDFQTQRLDDLDPLDVFKKRCEINEIKGDAYQSLLQTFQELMILVTSDASDHPTKKE